MGSKSSMPFESKHNKKHAINDDIHYNYKYIDEKEEKNIPQYFKDIVFGYMKIICKKETHIIPSEICNIILQFYYIRLVFNSQNVGNDLQFYPKNNENIVKKITRTDHWSTCVFGEEIDNTMCNKFNIYVKYKKGCGDFMMGYLTSNIENSVINWNCHLGYYTNKFNSVGYECHSKLNYFIRHLAGNKKSLSYKAPNNFKEGDTFQFSFNFRNNKLIIYHNEIKAVTNKLLNKTKQFTFAICMNGIDQQIEITHYEFF
eukprot:100146_1